MFAHPTFRGAPTDQPAGMCAIAQAPRDGMLERGAGTCRRDAADAGRVVAPSRVSTVVPGAQRAPNPIAARACGTW